MCSPTPNAEKNSETNKRETTDKREEEKKERKKCLGLWQPDSRIGETVRCWEAHTRHTAERKAIRKHHAATRAVLHPFSWK
jgi:hypothetical protein